MAVKTEETMKVETPTGGEGTPPPKVETKTEPKTEPAKVETKTDPKTETTKTPEGKSGGGGMKRAQISIEDEIPEDAELLELSRTALTSRLKRHTAKELRERFGTDDTNEIKKKLDRLASLEADEERRKREAMSEKERLEADLRTKQAENEELSRQLNIERNEKIVRQEDHRITRIAHKYIEDDEDTTEVVFRRFASHLKSEYSEELKNPDFNIPDKEIDKWFKQYATDHPKHAKSAQERNVEKRPLNNGAPGSKEAPPPENKSGTPQTKNFAPSGPNAMSRQEAKAEAAKLGYGW